MEFKGLKGPWVIFDAGETIDINTEESDGFVLVAEIPKGGDKYSHLLQTKKANAQIMAAAPDLLKALQKYHDMAIRIDYPTEQELNELAEKSQLAIHKALEF